MDFTKTKHGRESTLDWSDFDDFGVVEKLRSSAIQRHQNHQNPTNLRSIPGHVLDFIHFGQNQRFLR